jgi:hypothetical protein
MGIYPTHYCHEPTERTVLQAAPCIPMGGQELAWSATMQKLVMLHLQIQDPVILGYSVSIYDKVILKTI